MGVFFTIFTVVCAIIGAAIILAFMPEWLSKLIVAVMLVKGICKVLEQL